MPQPFQPVIVLLSGRRARDLNQMVAGWGFLPDTDAFQRESVPLVSLSFDYGEDRIVYLDSDDDPGSEPDETNDEDSGPTDEGVDLPDELEGIRDIGAEQACEQALRDLGFIRVAELAESSEIDAEFSHNFMLPGDDEESAWLRFLMGDIRGLKEVGWRVEESRDFPYRVVDDAETWYADIEDAPRSGWFGLELGIMIEGQSVNLLPLLLELLGDRRFTERLATLDDDERVLVPMQDGRYLPVQVRRARAILSVVAELHHQSPRDKGQPLTVNRLVAPHLAELDSVMDGAKMRWMGGAALRDLGRRLKGFDGIEEVLPPDDFQADLRHYQQDGLNWLQFLREYRLGGILADDMGLGKTIQTLAHLLIEKRSGRMDQPSLVVTPTSLLFNWFREAEQFAPDLRVLIVHGPDRKRLYDTLDDYDVILTTYPLLPRDREVLMKREFHLLILDEAQIIKNPRTKASQAAYALRARHRLCLTGTPMENHLGELWSLFNFALPGLLGNEKFFRRTYRLPIENHDDQERRSALVRRIAPFMLRRTKEAVVSELPPKTDILRTVELEERQRDLYETIRLALHRKVRDAVRARGFKRNRVVVLDALLKLRQVCCDPRLLKVEAAKGVNQSAKLNLLMDMLPEMVEEGRRILLFSQFTSMLALIEKELIKRKLEYVTLTGSTQDRATPVTQFQDGEVPLFLISLKAGGMGLNLTRADTVIHYDPWWNPSVEAQATDRAHRIGQDKAVFVYRLITAGTVEEKILALQKSKAGLAEGLFEGGGGVGELDSLTLDSLFEPVG